MEGLGIIVFRGSWGVMVWDELDNEDNNDNDDSGNEESQADILEHLLATNHAPEVDILIPFLRLLRGAKKPTLLRGLIFEAL